MQSFSSPSSDLVFDDAATEDDTASPPSAPSIESANWIAFGSIRLAAVFSEAEPPKWLMYDSPKKDIFPNDNFTLAERRRWLRTERLDHITSTEHAVLRIFVLPEDVERGARASVKDLRRVIRWLLTFVDVSHHTWNGNFIPTLPPKLYGVPSADQDESLFYIFNTLDSPNPRINQFSGSPYALDSMEAIVYDRIPGLITQLYPYQKSSVAMMLRREEDPTRSPDQRKPQYLDVENNPFHMDVFDGIIIQDPQLYTEPRGGILAETMGYGKTLACLALVLATRGHYPHVPEGRIENRSPPRNPTTSSLLRMAARTMVHAAIPWKADFHALRGAGYHYDHVVEELKTHTREFAEPIFNPTTPNRKASAREAERILRLCYGTLVIVPPNLVTQWQSEIVKHLEEDALDVLVITKSTQHIPSWRDLMHYDMVLISKTRLDQEYKDNDLNEGKRYVHEVKYRSPLTEIRWLRIICDEGHDFAGSSSTHAMAMLAKMSVERRWIISGTPSGSAYGVEVNLAATEPQSSPRKASLTKALEDRRLPDSVKQEIKDLEKLRTIIVNFLRLQPWANQKGSDHASWNKYLAPFDAAGQRRCIPGLRPLLQSLIVRHRIEELDIDVPLPALHNRTVYLEPSYHDKLSLNLFILVITANAITSERTDEDYMFHPRNRKELNQLISNLRQSTFHWVGSDAASIAETMRVNNKYFDSHLDTMSDSDALLLTEGLLNGVRALHDPSWCAFSTLHEMGVYVENFPGLREAHQAWSLHDEPTSPLLLGTTQARAVQQWILSNVNQQDPTAGLLGAGLRVMTESRKKAEEQQESKRQKAAKALQKDSTLPGRNSHAGLTEEVTLTKSSRTPARLVISMSNSSRKRRRSNNSSVAPTRPSDDVLRSLQRTRIVGFTSAKLSYLCSQLLQHSRTSKSIVFYESSFGNIAFWLAEALELLSIPHLIYASTLKQELRSKYLRDFNTDNKYRVLIMDLKQASLGLHIAAANRVYITTPIWSKALEAQAIKRAHRIGQEREVYVETLVLKGTVEERMWARRKGMTEREGRVNVSEWGDDGGVRGIIEGEGFARFEDGVGDLVASARGSGETERKTDIGLKVARLDVPQPLFRIEGNEGLATADEDGEAPSTSTPINDPGPIAGPASAPEHVPDADSSGHTILEQPIQKKRRVGGAGVRFE